MVDVRQERADAQEGLGGEMCRMRWRDEWMDGWLYVGWL